MVCDIDEVKMPKSGRFPLTRTRESLDILRRSDDALCHFGLIQKDGTRFLYRNPACYAPLSYVRSYPSYRGRYYPDTNSGNVVVSFFDYIQISKKQQESKESVAYVDWLANRSSWAPAFRTKDPERILREGTIFNVNQPAQLVIGAAITIRYFKEYPARPVVWALLSDIVDPHTAFVLSHIYYAENSSGNYAEAAAGWGMGHSVFDSMHVGLRELENIKNSKIIKANDKPFSKDTNYYGMNCMWGTRGPEIKIKGPAEKLASTKNSYGKPCWSVDEIRERVAFSFGGH